MLAAGTIKSATTKMAPATSNVATVVNEVIPIKQ